MRRDARRGVVGIVVALCAGNGLCQPGDAHVCVRRSASSAGSTTVTRGVPTAIVQEVACGPLTLAMATPPMPAVSTPADDRHERTPAEPRVPEALRRLGLYGAAGLLTLAVLLMLAAFVMANRRQGIAINRDSIRFGGAGRGCEVSPAFAALVAAAVVAAMATVLSMAALDAGTGTARPDVTAARDKPV